MNKILFLIIVAFFLALFNLVFVVKTFSQDSIIATIKYPDGTTINKYSDGGWGYDKSDSIQVKILKVKGNSVEMKTMKRPRVKLFTFCKCPYKEGQIIWIKKP